MFHIHSRNNTINILLLAFGFLLISSTCRAGWWPEAAPVFETVELGFGRCNQASTLVKVYDLDGWGNSYVQYYDDDTIFSIDMLVLNDQSNFDLVQSCGALYVETVTIDGQDYNLYVALFDWQPDTSETVIVKFRVTDGALVSDCYGGFDSGWYPLTFQKRCPEYESESTEFISLTTHPDQPNPSIKWTARATWCECDFDNDNVIDEMRTLDACSYIFGIPGTINGSLICNQRVEVNYRDADTPPNLPVSEVESLTGLPVPPGTAPAPYDDFRWNPWHQAHFEFDPANNDIELNVFLYSLMWQDDRNFRPYIAGNELVVTSQFVPISQEQ